MALTQISTEGIKNGTITGSDLATNVDLVDNQKLRLGTGNDLQIYHNGSDSYIDQTGTGDFYIRTTSLNEDVIVQAGLGGDVRLRTNAGENAVIATMNAGVELYYDNDKVLNTIANGIQIDDNTKIFENSTHNTAIIQHADIHHSIVLRGTTNADGSTITNANTTTFREYGDFVFRTGQVYAQERLIIESGGTSRFVNNVEGQADENMAKFIPNGAVELYYDNGKKFETTNSGAECTGYLKATGGSGFGFITEDNVKFSAGTGNDLQLYHDGSNSYLEDAGTGALLIKSNTIYLTGTNASNDLASFVEGGAASLFFNDVKKFETTSDGVSVTGTLTTDKATFTDDGSGSPIVHIRTDDESPWAFVINNDSSANDTTSGLKWYVANSGDASHQIRGYGAYKNYIITTSNSSNSDTAFKINSSRGVELYYQDTKKFETTSSGATVSGNLRPGSNNNFDLGTSSIRWRNIYTNDLNLSNEGNTNDIDGTWGSYTIQEGEESLFLINKRNGKKYKFNLTEVL